MSIDRRRLLAHTALAAVAAPMALRAHAFGLGAAARGTLTAYASEAELRQALARWHEQSQRGRGESRRREASAMADSALGQAMPSSALSLAAPAAKAAAPAAEAESITNVQTAGVDEGGIVKRAGDFLIILRRGRLFTVRVGGDALAPIAAVDAYAPGSNPSGAWYDELLVSGRDVVVVGYS
jgi:hypothetical protein